MGKRYEIVDGELYVTRAPHSQHQKIDGRLFAALEPWSCQTTLGEAELGAGLILGDQNDVILNVMWMTKARHQTLMDEVGHFRRAPELVVDVLSPGAENEKRDRQLKRKLYSTHGVWECWIVEGVNRQVEVYQQVEGQLKHGAMLDQDDLLTSPLLPGFACPSKEILG
ncbi:MAG: Uma2 family endonuclease [Gloeomargarita sp. SZTDM-1c_bins_89]